MTEKQETEKDVAELFLRLYNSHMESEFQIKALSDAPDVICEDQRTGKRLELEIALLEDLPGSIRSLFSRGRQPRSRTTGTTAVSFVDDVVPTYMRTIERKLLSDYGANTALVLYQVSDLWEPFDWSYVASKFGAKILTGREHNFGAGIWVICRNHRVSPSTHELFCLSSSVQS